MCITQKYRKNTNIYPFDLHGHICERMFGTTKFGMMIFIHTIIVYILIYYYALLYEKGSHTHLKWPIVKKYTCHHSEKIL